MTISINLSTESIARAVVELAFALENLEFGVEDAVSIMTNEGAEIAQGAYGGMAGAFGVAEGMHGTIFSVGDGNVIAEFGAGQAVIPPGSMFENSPATPVYEGSYSELEGSGEYAQFGSWHFGGRYYTEVPARHGLFDAKEYIIENSTEIALGAIQL